MIDITSVGNDLNLIDTDVPRAANLLNTQVGQLEYAPDFGIDLEFFLDERFLFQNESFRAYLVEVLANNSINVSEVVETVETLFKTLQFRVSSMENDTSLVR